MTSIMHYNNNKQVCIYNIYKYLANLYKIGAIPEFKVEIHNKLTEVVFTFNYNNKYSTIKYNTNSGIWTSYTNILTLDEIYNNPDFSYLFDNKMIGYENNMIILQSYDINDILEPSLTPFNNNQRNLYDVNNTKLHNLDHRHYYMFINNLINNDKNIIINECEENYNLHYLNYNEFVNEYV